MTIIKCLAQENIWLNKCHYDSAECNYYEAKAKEFQTPLAAEVGRAREWLINIKNSIENGSPRDYQQEPISIFQNGMDVIEEKLQALLERIVNLENHIYGTKTHLSKRPLKTIQTGEFKDVDLFESDSEEDVAAEEIRRKRLADYESKKSKKPALIAKSSIVMDIKPWGNDTDMKLMEQDVRKIQMEGLVWGASKLVPLAYGIYKLQIMVVIEDDKVSVDLLQEQIEAIEEYVQSVDIAAFNKI